MDTESIEYRRLEDYVRNKMIAKSSTAGYRVLAREPGISRGSTVAGPYEHIQDARNLIVEELSYEYPEGTLLYIVHEGPGISSSLGLKETYQITSKGITKLGGSSDRGHGWISRR